MVIKLYVVKLSKNVSADEPEPEVYYTSTIHGDETTGFVLMLRLIDYLLSNYAINPGVTAMVNGMAIYINPNANPDGTYYANDNTVSGAQRYNTLGVDLNRNFPDAKDGLHPDGHVWQTENLIQMNFVSSRHFTLSANFHGGVEVVNYPWDAWVSSSKIHPDNNWYIHTSRQYADTAHLVKATYMSYLDNGITNGGDWYVISGGRQDYMNFWHHCREVTMEISNTKLLGSELLPSFWNYNKNSLINYLLAATKGFSGVVTNTSGNALKAKVFISGHDADSSHVYSSQSTGFYARPIEPGTWQVTYSASGYVSQTHSIVIDNWNSTVIKNVQLVPFRKVTFDVNYLSNPVVGAIVFFNGISLNTDSNGRAVFNDVPEGNGYGYSITISGFRTVVGNVGVSGDEIFTIDLVSDVTPVYTVTFDVKHLGVAIENANVEFNGIEQQTKSNGLASFTNIVQGTSYTYSVTKTGFFSEAGVLDIAENRNVNIEFVPFFKVLFKVQHLGLPIAGVKVSFNGKDRNTLPDGSVAFDSVEYGNGYIYSISKSGYRSYSNQVDITSAKNVDVELIPEFTVLFNIKNQGVSVPNANISFNSLNQQTLSDGTSIFTNVLYGLGYGYTVSLTEYKTLSGQVDVTENKIINIELTKVGIGVQSAENYSLSIWPNPFSNLLNVKFKLDKPSFVNLSIYSIDGRFISTVANALYQAGDVVLGCNGSSLTGGSYLIKLQVGEKTFSQIIQHIP